MLRSSKMLAHASSFFTRTRMGDRQKNGMAYSITKKEIAAQPVLVVRRRIKPSEVAATLAEVLGQVFMHAQQQRIALAGQPFTRYLEWGPGFGPSRRGCP